MRTTQPSKVTGLLLAWGRGDESALDRLMPLVYRELRRIAQRFMAREAAGHTLQATALVNEAYLRLVDAREVDWRDRAHFFSLSARVMRRVLVDHARARDAQKRLGQCVRVSFDDTLAVSDEPALDVAALDDALAALEKFDPRKSRVVEMRFFAGLSVEETATVLNVSADTVMRDWRLAKAWLQKEMRGASGPDR
jgi:RNA polymerase sigma factor (TIGR02999 family)